jgi:hypothetical protein
MIVKTGAIKFAVAAVVATTCVAAVVVVTSGSRPDHPGATSTDAKLDAMLSQLLDPPQAWTQSDRHQKSAPVVHTNAAGGVAANYATTPALLNATAEGDASQSVSNDVAENAPTSPSVWLPVSGQSDPTHSGGGSGLFAPVLGGAGPQLAFASAPGFSSGALGSGQTHHSPSGSSMPSYGAPGSGYGAPGSGYGAPGSGPANSSPPSAGGPGPAFGPAPSGPTEGPVASNDPPDPAPSPAPAPPSGGAPDSPANQPNPAGPPPDIRGTDPINGPLHVVPDQLHSPGHSPGQQSIGGDYILDGTLHIELAGTIPGLEYDQLLVDGMAILNGKIEVVLLNDFVPELTDVFDIIIAEDGFEFGDLFSIVFPELPGGHQFAYNLVDLADGRTAFRVYDPPVASASEPVTLGLIGFGLAALAAMRRRSSGRKPSEL